MSSKIKKTKQTNAKKSKKTDSEPVVSAEEINVEPEAAPNDDAINELQEQVLELNKENDALKKEVEDLKEQSLRSLAELENVKRRKEQEKQDAIKFANERLVMDLLPVLDGFELAMNQGDFGESTDVSAVVAGFSMIQKQIEQFLGKCGVVRIDAMDQPFDPNLHQGISQESHPDKIENTIVKEMQPGYRLNDRVIRPSMVVVSTK
ncbi:MAG: nucleotide exchange factor GrpE [Candidatus Margulisbacteria bacterium]|nr:nucleotide exchange factor GrpE [Candidatus Margulisiibacteriota bacterium]